MRFSIFLPPQPAKLAMSPAVYWLSGLTCTDENFSHKAGAQRFAAALGLALVVPDTSPRGAEIPDDPDGAFDLGLGAGFYVNATEEPWRRHYRMYDYVVKELPATLILRPFNFETLAVSTYIYASEERMIQAAAPAIAIVLIGLIPIVLLSKMIRSSRPIENRE